MRWPLVLLFASVAFASDGPRLFYSRSFPGSTPAYFDITVESNGDTAYREAVDDELPSKFHLSEAESKEVFALADKLDHFKRPLESPLKVAFMGNKTFRYEKGSEKAEVKFNSRKTRTGAHCSTGSNVWPNRPSTAITWSAPPSTITWDWWRR